MGTIRVGSVVSDIRGKVGEEIYSRGPGGLQVRSVGSWVQPDTQRQIDQRTICAKLAVAWSGLLSEDQRAGWRAYAKQWPRVNRWGEPMNIGGYQAFFRACAYYFKALGDLAPGNPVVLADLLVKDAPPGGPSYPPVMSFGAVGATDVLTVQVQPVNYPALTSDAFVWLFAGKPVGVGVNWFGGPWRYWDHNVWTVGWVKDPWTGVYPWPVEAGEKLHVEAVLQFADSGEVSTRGRSVAVAT